MVPRQSRRSASTALHPVETDSSRPNRAGRSLFRVRGCAIRLELSNAKGHQCPGDGPSGEDLWVCRTSWAQAVFPPFAAGARRGSAKKVPVWADPFARERSEVVASWEP